MSDPASPVVDPAPVIAAPSPEPAPVVDTGAAAAAPAVDVPAAAEPAAAGSLSPADPAPAGEPAADPAKPFAHTDTPSLLGAAGKDGDKPADPPKPADPAPEAPKPTFTAFELPEGMSVPEAQLTAYHDVLGKYGLSQEAGQELIGMHAQAMQQYRDSEGERQQRAFDALRKSWRDEVMGDEVLGGAGHRTTMSQIARVLDTLVPNATERQALNAAFDMTGAGDHPAVLKLVHAMAKFVNEPRVPKITDPQPTKTNGRAPGRKALYDNTNFSAG